MAVQSVETFLIGKTVKRKLVVSHLFSSVVPFLVVVYLMITYVFPRMPAGSIYAQVLIAIAALIGVLVATGYYIAWDLGRTVSALARNAETQEGFEAFIERDDEIGAIMRAFSRALEVLKERAEEINELSAKLDAANQEVESTNLKLREETYTDELTGIYNRRVFNLALQGEISRSERYQHSFSLVLLDVDHLRSINEQHGNAGGDRVLARIGRILKANSRASDVVCRFGGEEFAVVLPERGFDRARGFADKILELIRTHEFRLDDDSTLNVTASAGVTLYPAGGRTFDELVSTADHALSQAKREGRDCVYIQEEPAE